MFFLNQWVRNLFSGSLKIISIIRYVKMSPHEQYPDQNSQRGCPSFHRYFFITYDIMLSSKNFYPSLPQRLRRHLWTTPKYVQVHKIMILRTRGRRNQKYNPLVTVGLGLLRRPWDKCVTIEVNSIIDWKIIIKKYHLKTCSNFKW